VVDLPLSFDYGLKLVEQLPQLLLTRENYKHLKAKVFLLVTNEKNFFDGYLIRDFSPYSKAAITSFTHLYTTS